MAARLCGCQYRSQHSGQSSPARRDAVQDGLLELGVPTVVYYPRPLHSQPAYAEYPAIDLPESEAVCSQVLSLPMHPYLEEAVQDLIVEGVNKLI